MKKLTEGTEVLVKFAPGTIGFKYQGPGWHSGTFVFSYLGTYEYPVQYVKLEKLTEKAKFMFQDTHIPVYSFKDSRWSEYFAGTVIRKVASI